MDQGPEIYRVGIWQVLLAGRSPPIIWLGLLCVILLISLANGTPQAEALAAAGAAGLVLLAAYLVHACRTLELWPDRIVLKGLFGRREILCRDLKGYRRPIQRWVSLEARPPAKGAFIRQGNPGDALEAWLGGLTNLYDADLEQDRQAFLADPAFGDTPEERQAKLDFWSRILKPANVAGFVLTIVMVLWDFPPAWLLALGALGPPLAVGLVLASRGVATLSPPSPSPRPTAAGLLLPGAALTFRVLMDFNFVGGPRVTLTTLGLCAVLAIGLLALDRRALASPRAILVLGLAALAYGWGGAMAADVDLDQAANAPHRATVLDLTSSGGRHTTYHAVLSAWGPYAAPHELKISHDQYYALEKGQTVCPRLHPGAFGAPWAEVTTCSD